MVELRCRLQMAEALGPANRWFCSKAYGRPIDDPELLLAYYIRNGGAVDFAKRFSHAMGHLNRWYCSQFYGREIHDREILWDYYVTHAHLRAAECEADGCQIESTGV
jgi:hypothetical protein